MSKRGVEYEPPVSAFAFDTAERIENYILESVGDIKSRAQTIEAKVLSWYDKTKDEDFAKFMGIKN